MKYKKKQLAFVLLFYPFGVFTALNLMLNREKKIKLFVCALAILMFSVTFFPSASKVDINADEWEYIYSGGIGLNGVEYKQRDSTTSTTAATTTTAVFTSEEPAKIIDSEPEQDNKTTVKTQKPNKPKTTKSKTTKPKTTTKKTSKVSSENEEDISSIIDEVSEKPIIYLYDDSQVYTNYSYSYMHTDYKCKNLKNGIIIMKFSQSVKKGIPYCPYCADTVLYVEEEDEIITDYE